MQKMDRGKVLLANHYQKGDSVQMKTMLAGVRQAGDYKTHIKRNG